MSRGMVLPIGDLNSRTGIKKECVMNDILSSEVIDRLLPFVDYDSDMIAHSSIRETDDWFQGQ